MVGAYELFYSQARLALGQEEFALHPFLLLRLPLHASL